MADASKLLCLVLPVSLLLLLPLLVSPGAAAVSASPLNICGTNATVGGWVISSFNLSYPGLEAVAEAAHKGDLNDACELIAQYYKTSDSGAWMRVPAPPPSTTRAGGRADDALNDVFWLSGVDVEAHVPRNPDGGLDWYYTGPRKDPECMNCASEACWRRKEGLLLLLLADSMCSQHARLSPLCAHTTTPVFDTTRHQPVPLLWGPHRQRLPQDGQRDLRGQGR
jgi:hypothetical protein